MKSQAIPLFLASISLALCATFASADTIELRDGRKVSGTMSRQGDLAVIKAADGKTITVAFAEVLHVTLTNSDSPADAAKSEWTRIAAQIKTAPDLAAIIALHQKFLEKYPDSPLVKEVKDSLGVYQQLADVQAVKFHGKWMPPDQIDVMTKQWTQAAGPALAAYKAGKFKEAQDAATTVLVKDDQNPDALNLAGLAAYQTKNYGVARKYFTLLSESDPTSGLAQHNLAILSFQEKKISEGLAQYTKALALMPANPLLLDNIAELINAYKDSGCDVKAADFRTLSTAYAPAESALEAQMAQRGLSRFGSTWATKDEMAAAGKNAKLIRSQLEPVEAKYKHNHEAIVDVEAKIKQAYADSDTAADKIRDIPWITGVGFLGGNRVEREFELDAALIAAEKNWQLADQNVVRQLVRRFDLRVREVPLIAQAQQLKTQLANSEGFFPSELRMMDNAASKTLAGDYIPRPLPADATKPLDAKPLSTVSKPDPEPGSSDEPSAKGTVKIAYLPVITAGGEVYGTPFFLEVPTEQPGTYACSFGNIVTPAILIHAGGARKLSMNRRPADKLYWIDSGVRDIPVPALMPSEYIGTTYYGIPALGFGRRISATAPIGLRTKTSWSPYTPP